jgi:hypothetical protein
MSAPLYSNCAGNPDCNCNSNFNNMVGIGSYSHTTGTIQPISTPTIQVSASLPTVQLPVPTTAPTTTTPIQPSTLDKALTIGTSLLGMFSKPATTTSTPVPLPQDEKKVPTAVWVVVGGLLVLVIAYVIVKAA